MTTIQHYTNFRRRRDYSKKELSKVESYKIKISNKESSNEESSNEEINEENLFQGGYTVENLNGTNTFINYLIKRRLSSNSSGFSSHIAAFVSKLGSKKQCLLRKKGKHRGRRKL
jgi:hypothetical protein